MYLKIFSVFMTEISYKTLFLSFCLLTLSLVAADFFYIKVRYISTKTNRRNVIKLF